MRTLFLALLALSVTGCTSWSMNYHLNNAYRAYKSGDCQRVPVPNRPRVTPGPFS